VPKTKDKRMKISRISFTMTFRWSNFRENAERSRKVSSFEVTPLFLRIV